MSVEKELAEYICKALAEEFDRSGTFTSIDSFLDSMSPESSNFDEWDWAFNAGFISEEAYEALKDDIVDDFKVGRIIAEYLTKF
jgi:hypothetical protein